MLPQYRGGDITNADLLTEIFCLVEAAKLRLIPMRRCILIGRACRSCQVLLEETCGCGQRIIRSHNSHLSSKQISFKDRE